MEVTLAHRIVQKNGILAMVPDDELDHYLSNGYGLYDEDDEDSIDPSGTAESGCWVEKNGVAVVIPVEEAEHYEGKGYKRCD